MSTDSQNKPQTEKNHTFWQAWGHAAHGLSMVVREERNMQKHIAFAIVAFGLSWWLSLNQMEWLWIILAVFIVMLTEINNTIAETLCDLTTGNQFHPLAKKVKDIAAGAVVFSAFFAVTVGAIILLPKLWQLLNL